MEFLDFINSYFGNLGLWISVSLDVGTLDFGLLEIWILEIWIREGLDLGVWGPWMLELCTLDFWKFVCSKFGLGVHDFGAQVLDVGSLYLNS